MHKIVKNSLLFTASVFTLGSLGNIDSCNAASFAPELGNDDAVARKAFRTADLKQYKATEQEFVKAQQQLLQSQAKGENTDELRASIAALTNKLKTQIDNGAQSELMAEALAQTSITDTLKSVGNKIKSAFVSQPSKSVAEDNREELNVLTLDGGGTRGIGTLCMLSVLEMKTGKKTHEMFDRIYGTSTGGLMAIMLAKGMSATEVLEIYFNNMEKIFSRSWYDTFTNPMGLMRATYNPEGLENLIKEVCGDKHLKDVKVPVSVTVTNAATGEGVLLSSEDEETRDVSILEAARATSAAPTYFPAMNVHLKSKEMLAVDGGIAANNPAELAYFDIEKKFGNSKKINLISLGTGVEKPVVLDKNAGKLGFGNPGNIPSYFMGNNERNIEKRMNEMHKLGKLNEYQRINFELPFVIDLADTSQKAKDSVMQLAWKRANSDDFTDVILNRVNNEGYRKLVMEMREKRQQHVPTSAPAA